MPSLPHLNDDPILLTVTGMSPAILTETLWALAHEPEPIVPSRIIAVTTADGRREIERRLFQPEPRFDGQTPWDTLRAALIAEGHDLNGRLRFGTTSDDVRVITAVESTTGQSRELADIRTREDNSAAADFLLEQVRALVENPDTRLIASLAGGRKTMGALLYACLTLTGRETDRLTHVLVSSPFETLPGFWFPGQPGGPIPDRDGKSCSPSQARIDLADVLFVPLRNLFQRELGRPAGSFARLVELCREQVRERAGEHVRLTVDQTRPEIDVNGTTLRLAPREHVVLLFLAVRQKGGDPALGAYRDAVDLVNQFREGLVASAPGQNLADWRHGDSLKSKFLDDQELRRAVSGLRDRLRRAGGNAPLLAPCLPERGRFSLEVPPPLIHLK